MADRKYPYATSPAFLALTRGGKRCLHLIEDAIISNGDGVAISLNNFGLSRIAARNGIKQLVALGFIQIEFGRRRISTFRLTDGWLSVATADEAKQLVRAAESPRAAISKPAVTKPVKVPKPAPVEPRTQQRQQPLLPKLSCLQGDP